MERRHTPVVYAMELLELPKEIPMAVTSDWLSTSSSRELILLRLSSLITVVYPKPLRDKGRHKNAGYLC